MKQLIICVAMLSLILSGIAFANDQEYDTVVGPVMDNRFVNLEERIKPGEEGQLSETSQKLMDQGVIPAAEAARQAEQSRVVVQPSRNN